MEAVCIELKGLFGPDRTHVSKASPVPRALLYRCSVDIAVLPFPSISLLICCAPLSIFWLFSLIGAIVTTSLLVFLVLISLNQSSTGISYILLQMNYH